MEALGTWLDNRGGSETSLWHRISKGNSMFYAKKTLFCDPKTRSTNALTPSTLRVYLLYFMALENGHIRRGMFHSLRTWELGKLRRILCLRRRPHENWVDYMKRKGLIVAKQLKKYNQTRIQSLAMKRVKIAAWHMATCPNDAKGRRYWEEVVTWRCDECWKEAYANLTKEDYHNTTQWKRPLSGRCTYLEMPFTRFCGDAWIPKLKR